MRSCPRLIFEGPDESADADPERPAGADGDLARRGARLRGRERPAAGRSVSTRRPVTRSASTRRSPPWEPWRSATAARLLRLRGEAMQAAVARRRRCHGRRARPRPGGGGGARRRGRGGDRRRLRARQRQRRRPGGALRRCAQRSSGPARWPRREGPSGPCCCRSRAPFHCRLMEPAADAIGRGPGGDDLHGRRRMPVIANVTGRADERSGSAAAEPDPAGDGPGALARDDAAFCRERGHGVIAELGAGKVLTGLAKRAVPDRRALQHPIGQRTSTRWSRRSAEPSLFGEGLTPCSIFPGAPRWSPAPRAASAVRSPRQLHAPRCQRRPRRPAADAARRSSAETLGERATVLVGDLADAERARRRSARPRPATDILVNNAGITRDSWRCG